MVAGFLGRMARRVLDRPPYARAAAPDAGGEPPTLEAALALHQSGRWAEAREHYCAILAVTPDRGEAIYLLGLLTHQQGDSEAAVPLMRRALEMQPDNTSARANLGLVLRSLGRLDEAEAELRRAIDVDPNFDTGYSHLAIVLRDRGDLAGAQAALTRATAINPGNVDALNNLGGLCKETGRLEEAETHYRRALALRPGSARIWENLGAVAIARRDWAGAESCYRAAIEADADAAVAWSSLGYVLGQAGRLVDAQAACLRALAIRPDWPDAMVNLAIVLKDSDPESAEDLGRRALAIDAKHVNAYVVLGEIGNARLDLAEAERCYRRALELDPRSPTARYNLGIVRVTQGHYVEGFEMLESRFEAFPKWFSGALLTCVAANDGRRWQGGSLAGKRVLVWCEQGFGDNLMMLRYLRLLKGLGAEHVTVACDAELRRIVGAIPEVDQVLASEIAEPAREFDVFCPTMSLPYCFRTTIDTVPFAGPYVTTPDDVVAAGSARLAGLEGLRVGLAWAGNDVLGDPARKSVPLADFSALFAMDEIALVSLQKGTPARQLLDWPGALLDPMDGCRDFMDTAGVIANLDLVITVDTAVAHLAGAMGKPTWLLVRAGGEWRWGTTGERSPWYPSLRIFRQQQFEDWQPAMRNVAGALDALVRTHR